MPKAYIVKEEETKAQGSEPINWDKLAIRIGVGVSFVTIIGFLISLAFFIWTFHADVVSVTEKLGILEGKMEILLKDTNYSSNPAKLK